jgi:hypothetical protein
MVFCQMVAEETGIVRRLQQLQPLLIELVEGFIPPVNPVKQAEGYLSHHYLLSVLLSFRSFAPQGLAALPGVGINLMRYASPSAPITPH